MNSSDVAIRVENVSKVYRIGQLYTNSTLRESLTNAVTRPAQKLRSRFRGETPQNVERTFDALKDVTFDVRVGEVLGLIGRNGAGKSTLLKILSRITEPTSGRIELFGRIGSLLEVGTGFHPELTGRENIFLNGAILGMAKMEIKNKFDEIVAFAEVERFLDTPVKRYSSGMYTRLAFAVAAHLEPEILLVDEVLAVGDLAFQKKCLGKMNSVAQQGRTVVFVSHNMSMIQALCPNTIYLEDGRIKALGETRNIVAQYQASSAGSQIADLYERSDREGDGSVRIHSVRIESVDMKATITTASRLRILLNYESDSPLRHARFYVDVCDFSGTIIYALDTDSTGELPALLPSKGTVVCETHPINLTPGRCCLHPAVYRGGVLADRVENAAIFDVKSEHFFPTGIMHDREWTLGVIRHEWHVKSAEEEEECGESDRLNLFAEREEDGAQ